MYRLFNSSLHACWTMYARIKNVIADKTVIFPDGTSCQLHKCNLFPTLINYHVTVVKNCLISFCVKSSNHFLFNRTEIIDHASREFLISFPKTGLAFYNAPVAIEEVTFFAMFEPFRNEGYRTGIDGSGKPNQTTICCFLAADGWLFCCMLRKFADFKMARFCRTIWLLCVVETFLTCMSWRDFGYLILKVRDTQVLENYFVYL